MRRWLWILLLTVGAGAQTKVNLANQAQGILAAQNGGTGNTVNGNVGQVLIGDGLGHFVPGDPNVSYLPSTLFNLTPATSGQTSAAVRISTLNSSGTLYLTFAGITGSPSGCTLQIQNGDFLGNFLNDGGAITLTVANGETSQSFSAQAALSTAAQVRAIYTCTTFPTGGTLSVDFSPIVSGGGSGGGGGTVNQGSANTASNAWPTKIVDSAGVNVATVDSSGNVNVHIQAGGGSGGTSSNFGSGFPSAGTAAGAKVVSSAPSLTAGNMEAPELTLAGRLIVDNSQVTQPVSGTVTTTPPANASTNVAQFGGTNVVTGTGTSGSGIPRMTVSSDSNVLATQSGNWTTRVVGNAGGVLDAAGQNAGSPANELLVACQFNTSPTSITSGNVSPVQCNASGSVKVDGSGVTQPVSGTVTANIGTTNGLALDTSVNGLLLSQGSTTSGQKGPLLQAAVTTSAPSYTTAQTSPLSLNTSGGLRVDGSGVTQPVSGTVTANAGTGTFNIQANASVNLNQVAGSAVSTAATGIAKVGLTGSTGAAMDAAGQNAASPANELLTACQFNTSPTTITSGNISPIQCNSTGSVKVDGSGVTQPVSGTVTANAGTGTFNIQANASVNVNQVAGSAVSTAATGTQKVGISGATGVTLDAATGAAPPANAILEAGLGSGATGGLMVGAPVGDTYKNINVSTATTTLLVTGVSGRQVRITALHMVVGAADNVAMIEGTGATCGTGTAGMAGGTTAASGYNFAANGGIAMGDGRGIVMETATTGDSVCVVTSAATQLSGGLSYAIY